MPDPRPTRPQAPWVVVIPVKGFGRGKSRLSAPGTRRDDLALAFVLDVVEVAVGCGEVAEVLVVTGDTRVAEAVAEAGAAVAAEPASTGDGLNAAVEAGIRVAREHHPDAAVAALTSDLPCLTVELLTRALAEASRHPLAVVADATGVGTTMITGLPGTVISPAFGVDSRAQHERRGHTIIDFPVGSGIRHDVDSPEDLPVALRIGVGRHTAAVVCAMS